MQPQEPNPVPAPTPTPGPVPTGAVPATGKTRSRRLRLWLAIGGGVIALLCLGGVGIAVSFYDDATKIERSAPDAVVDNFLGAYLVSRDDGSAELYECKSGLNLTELAAYRSDIVNREKNFTVGITVSWSSLTVSVNGDRGSVATDLTKSTANGNERITKPWRFDVVDQDGWRVCGASQVS